MTTLSYARNGQTYSTDVENLSATSIAYLMQYGWAQSLQDSIAGREKKVGEEYFNTLRAKAIESVGPKPADMVDVDYEDLIEAAIDETRDHEELEDFKATDIHAQLSKRMDAILNGTVGTRSAGEPRDPLRAVAADMVRKKAKATGVKFTKDELDAKVTAILGNAVQRAKVEAEHAARQARSVETDLDI